jgi:thiol:disulfide interchange protein DsbD
MGRAHIHGWRIHGWRHDIDERVDRATETWQGLRFSGDHLRHRLVARGPDWRSVNLGGSGGFVAEAEHELPFKRIKTVDDLDRELAAASSQGKTAFLDFYADWCVSCKEMEAYTFTDSEVQATLSNTVWLQADVTANDDADQALLNRFGVFGPPTIVFFGTDGQQRNGYEVVGYMKAKDFVEHLRQALGTSETVAQPD